jgi:hypothetical protein
MQEVGTIKGAVAARMRNYLLPEPKQHRFRDIGFLDFIHRPGIKKKTKEKQVWSETGSGSVLR